MSIFEFVLTGLTLVLALVITRLLGGLRWIFDPQRRYWVHALMVLQMLVLTSLIWWGLWYARDVQWTYLSFAYNLLIGPGTLYFTATLLVPDNPRRVRSWREHYYKIHRPFFGAFAALVLIIFAGSLVYTNTPLWHFTRVIQAVALITCVFGYLSTQHRVHVVIVSILAVAITVAVVFSELAAERLLPNA